VTAPALLFVYNADSGLFNTLADIGHKIFSPDTYECALCALTHGYFKEREQWRTFVESLDRECTFLHRDEFLRRHPDQSTRLPAVFLLRNGELECCADAEAIDNCQDLPALQTLIRTRLADSGG
jgi:hypothetical protein